MSYAQSLSIDFRQASLSLKELLDQLQEDISALNLSSTELFHGLKQNLLLSWKNWEVTVKNYKISLQNMPKELRRRNIIKQLSKELEDFETHARCFLTEIKETSFQDFRRSLNRHIREADLYLKGVQSRMHQMAESVASLEEHPLVQKFLRGEPVLASRENMQWARKVSHTSLGLLFLYVFVYSGWSKTVLWTLAGGFILWAFVLETARHLNPRVNEWVCRYFRPIMREREKTKINSAMFFIVSMVIVYFVFPIEVTMLTMLFLAVGDPLAGIVGVYWGKRKLSPHVSLEGSLACFTACAALAALCAGVLFSTTLSLLPLLVFSLISGLIGALTESSFKKLDDNLVMPLLSAPLLWSLMHLFSLL